MPVRPGLSSFEPMRYHTSTTTSGDEWSSFTSATSPFGNATRAYASGRMLETLCANPARVPAANSTVSTSARRRANGSMDEGTERERWAAADVYNVLRLVDVGATPTRALLTKCKRPGSRTRHVRNERHICPAPPPAV